MQTNSRISRYLARRVVAEYKAGASRAPLCLILRHGHEAEEQYAALRVFYSRFYGDVARVAMGGHHYNKLTDIEKQRIREWRMAGVLLKYIAEDMGRHISTIHYFCKREGI